MFLSNPIHKYPLNTTEFFENPFAVWKQMHRDGPVVRSKLFLFGKVWFATTWQAASEVLKDQERFARDIRRAGRNSQLPFLINFLLTRKFRVLAESNILTSDKDEHRRLRFQVEEAFRRNQIEQLSPRIEAHSRILFRELTEQARRNHGVVEWSANYSRQLPLAVICELLGLPEGDRPKFKKWFKAFAEFKSIAGIFKVMPGMSKLLSYLQNQFEITRRNPRPGLISDLVQIEQQGDRLSKEELTSLVFVLLAAGHETTVHLINSAIRLLLRHPDQRDLLLSDWSLAESAVDEILRYDSTVYISKPRFAVSDMEFHGAEIRRGGSVVAVLGAANADPNKFDQPERFDITRSKNYHMTFGSGPHVCLGMKLAKAECMVAIRQLFDEFPGVRIQDYQWQGRIGMMGMKRFNLKLF